ncbi:MAG TPA: amino acid permease [Xanthobacteraceae bacterium]|jgi:APA family basic amino acid/polyamine antiporter|nr:amino acid permease [Xanthobacteraceae bacterium]
MAATPGTEGVSAARVTAVTATAIVIADMIGTGVFTSLGFQVADIRSGFVLLLLWLVGGIVALCGATCYAELAGLFPRSSGEYNFLRRLYHPAFGFVAGWISAFVGFAAPVALGAMAFGVYFQSVLPNAPPLISGLVIIWIAALVHILGGRFASAFHNVWTALKLLLIAVFIVAGLAFVPWQPIGFAPQTGDVSQIISAPFAISLVFVMYAYSGWNAPIYIAGDVADMARSLPRALMIGTAIVTVLYLALNAVFLLTAPLNELTGQIDVAMISGKHIFGPVGSRIVGGLISLGLVSSISAMMWIGPRVTMTMGEDMAVLGTFAKTSRGGVPIAAIVFQLAIADLLLLTGSFETVLDFVQLSLSLCSFFTVLGVIKMRITEPQRERPYRAWGYPLTPLVFLVVTAFMMCYLVVYRPWQSLASFAIMLSGLIAYYISRRVSNVLSPNSSNNAA